MKQTADEAIEQLLKSKTLNLMRGVLLAEEKKISQIFIDKIFDAIWRVGLNLNDNKITEKILKSLKLDPKAFFTDLINPKIKEDLRKRTDEAFIKGVFGAPTFVINNKLFWVDVFKLYLQ